MNNEKDWNNEYNPVFETDIDPFSDPFAEAPVYSINRQQNQPIAESQPQTEPIEQPALKVTTQPHTKPQSLDFVKIFSDFGQDYATMPGVVVGNVGLTISRFAIDRIKFTADKRDRIAILTNRVVAIKTHYFPAIGNILCFGGACCNVGDTPRVRYVFPVVVYETDKKGKILTTNTNLAVLSVGQDQYEALMAIQDEMGEISNFDLLVNCTDAEYQKLTFTPSQGLASWKRSPEITKKIAEEWQKVKPHLLDPIAKQMTEKQLLERLSRDGGSNAGTDLDMDNVFGD